MKRIFIIDTDIGGDPDDAFAVALACKIIKDPFLVITCDEREGMRAKFAQSFVRALGRQDVTVIQGDDATGCPLRRVV